MHMHSWMFQYILPFCHNVNWRKNVFKITYCTVHFCGPRVFTNNGSKPLNLTPGKMQPYEQILDTDQHYSFFTLVDTLVTDIDIAQ